jgi:hypothetical protein
VQPQFLQLDAKGVEASSQLSSLTTSATNSYQSTPRTQAHDKNVHSVSTSAAVNASSPKPAGFSKPCTAPGELGIEQPTLGKIAFGTNLSQGHLLSGSMPEMLRQSWDQGDCGVKGEKYVATGYMWMRKGSGSDDDTKKARSEEEECDIGLNITGMAMDDLLEDVHATTHYEAPPLHAQEQHSPSNALDRGYSSPPSKAPSLFQPSKRTSPESRVLPTYMSAFDYAIRPFLNHHPTHHNYNQVPPSSTTTSFTSSETSVSKYSLSVAHLSWQHQTEQVNEAPPPKQDLPEFLTGAKTLGTRLRYLTLKTALLRCAVLVRLINTSQEVVGNAPSSANSSYGFRVFPASRSYSRGRNKLQAGTGTRSRHRSPHSAHDILADSDASYEGNMENYETWLTIYVLAYTIAYSVAQKLENRRLQSRCLYWVGRAEWGLGNWENALQAFERIGLYGAEDLRSDEKDWEFWLRKIRARYAVDGEGLGVDIRDEKDGDADEKLGGEDKKKDFEEWEWEYITHGDLRSYEAARRRKHGKIRKRVTPDVLSPTSRHPSPFSARSPYNRYQERAFSPWDQVFGGGGDGGGGEVSPPTENLHDVFEKEWEGEDADGQDYSLGNPHVRRDTEPLDTGIEEEELRE